MQTRYGDGRAAVTHPTTLDVGADTLTFRIGETQHVWSYSDLRRADDGSGRVILKRNPDTGERLYLDETDSARIILGAPGLNAKRAFGIEGPGTIAAITGAAWSLAAVFLLAVPLGAGPIADHVPPRYRAQIADISWSQIDAFTQYCDDSDEAARILNDVAYRIMQESDVPMRDDVWITIVDAPFPNAFALPDHSIVVTDDLIALAEHPDELVGVLAHEIAHIEHNHIMKNIIRSVGAGIFFDVVFGGAGMGQMVAIASVNLASLRYSRGDETDADLRGLDYLDAAGIDTAGLARLFDRFAEQERPPTESEEEADGERSGGFPTMLSSHPATAERAAAARARSRAGLNPSMTDAEWQIVRAACGGVVLPQSEPAPTAPPNAPPTNQPPVATPLPAPGTKPD